MIGKKVKILAHSEIFTVVDTFIEDERFSPPGQDGYSLRGTYYILKDEENNLRRVRPYQLERIIN